MDYNGNSQNSGHLHNSTTVWTQPQTDEQRTYYSKHAAEKRVFGWITTLLQTAHGAIAFAAWTAIYLWVFKNITFMLPTAPFLAGGTLFALHVLFRTTWQTYWYDRLDDDPNTDSPIWVPAAIIVLLLFAEVQGARQYLSGQVTPVQAQSTDDIDQDHATTLASIEQLYRNQCNQIADVYKAKMAPLDRQIAALRARSADTDQERRSNRARIATLQSRRDQVLTEKAAALEAALATATASRNSEIGRRESAVAAVDNHNAGELARVTAELGSVSTYAWVLSIGLLALIAGLSYRTVRINVKSGILPLRNYTVLDAHGSIAERLYTAFGDAINRRALQFAVWIHRLLSPSQAITSFDGTVVAKPGTYNTPEGFYQPDFQPVERVHLKTEEEAAREVLEKMAANPGIALTPAQIRQEIALSQRTNGQYRNMPLGKPEAPAGPAEQPAGAATRQQPAPTRTYEQDLQYWKGMLLAQLAAYDKAILAGDKGTATAIQDFISTDGNSPVVKEGRRLHLVWGVLNGDFVVGRSDRGHYVPLEKVTEEALLSPSEPSGMSLPAEDEELFKQKPNLFKQKIQAHKDDTGLVIGIKYQKENGNWTTYAYPAVKAQYQIYLQRAQKGEVTPAVSDGLEKWEYAMTLFPQGRSVVYADRVERENMQVIKHQEEV